MDRVLEATVQLQRFTFAARQWQWRLARLARRLAGRKRTTYVDERVAEYRAYWKSAARALGATFEPLWDDIWEVREGARKTRLSNYLVQMDDPVTLRLAGNKPYCCAVAWRHGVPVAPHRIFRLRDIESGWDFMTSRPGPFVVKPATRSSSGLGITLHVRTRRQFVSAAALASLYSDELMVEAMVPAESCRLLYLDGELIHAVRRRGVRVTGDGRSSIAALLARLGLQHLWQDPLTAYTLEAQRLSLGSTPGAGREIVARYLPAAEKMPRHELRTVYNECITSIVCPELARELLPVVREIGCRFAGVDVLTNDPAVPLTQSGGVFLEINTTPGIHHHYIGGEGPAVAVRVLRHLLEESCIERRDRPFPAERRALS